MKIRIILPLLVYLSVSVAYSQDSARWKPVNEAEFTKSFEKVYDRNAKKLEGDGYIGKALIRLLLNNAFEEYFKSKPFKEDLKAVENIRKDTIKALQTENKKLAADNISLQALQGLDQQVVRLQTDSTEMEKTISSLQAARSALQSDSITLANKIQSDSEELADIRKQLSEALETNNVLQAENEKAKEVHRSFDAWKQKIVDDFNAGYLAIVQPQLADIDTSAVNALIKSASVLDAVGGEDVSKIKTQCRNLESLKKIATAYIAGEKVLQTSASKSAVNTVLKNIRSASGAAWTPEHKKEVGTLTNTLSAYSAHIDNFSAILGYVENISTKPENQNLPKRDIDEKIAVINKFMSLKLPTGGKYPASYVYLNSLLKQLTDSLTQYPKIDIAGFKNKLNK